MPCLLAIIAFFFPRLVILLLAIFSDYLEVYKTVLWPVLGFFFVPYTTLAYAWAMNAGGGLQGIYLVVFILAILVDLGIVGGGERARRRKRLTRKR